MRRLPWLVRISAIAGLLLLIAYFLFRAAFGSSAPKDLREHFSEDWIRSYSQMNKLGRAVALEGQADLLRREAAKQELLANLSWTTDPELYRMRLTASVDPLPMWSFDWHLSEKVMFFCWYEHAASADIPMRTQVLIPGSGFIIMTRSNFNKVINLVLDRHKKVLLTRGGPIWGLRSQHASQYWEKIAMSFHWDIILIYLSLFGDRPLFLLGTGPIIVKTPSQIPLRGGEVLDKDLLEKINFSRKDDDGLEAEFTTWNMRGGRLAKWKVEIRPAGDELTLLEMTFEDTTLREHVGDYLSEKQVHELLAPH